MTNLRLGQSRQRSTRHCRNVQFTPPQIDGLEAAAGIADRLGLATRGGVEMGERMGQAFAYDLVILGDNCTEGFRPRLGQG